MKRKRTREAGGIRTRHSRLNIDGVITRDQQHIADFCANFYKVLYSSEFSQTAADNLLNSPLVKKNE